MAKVTAILATFNGKNNLIASIDSLTRQSMRLSNIIVVNNGSTDGSYELLQRCALGCSYLTVLNEPRNLGNPEAIRIAAAHAFAKGAEWIWLLDDDAWPEPEALSNLIMPNIEPKHVYSSLVVGKEYGSLSFPVAFMIGEQQFIARSIAELPAGNEFTVRGAWLGALISRQVYGEVGEVNGGLFIRGEDEEFPARIRKAGVKTLCRPQSRIQHPRMHLDSISFFGKRYFHERNLALWKAFYQIRNQTFVRKNYSGSPLKGCIVAFANLFLAIAFALFRENRKWSRIRLYFRAWRDGWTGHLGKTVEPGSI